VRAHELVLFTHTEHHVCGQRAGSGCDLSQEVLLDEQGRSRQAAMKRVAFTVVAIAAVLASLPTVASAQQPTRSPTGTRCHLYAQMPSACQASPGCGWNSSSPVVNGACAMLWTSSPCNSRTDRHHCEQVHTHTNTRTTNIALLFFFSLSLSLSVSNLENTRSGASDS
jgi:hypothetical protein